MSLTGPLDTAAAYSARLHAATCTITRPGAGDPVFDSNTGTYTNPPPTTVYTGACLFTPDGGDRVQQFGEGPVVTRTYTVGIEDTSIEFRVEDTVTIDTARDPQAVGMELVVLDVPKSEHVTVRRLSCEEVL